MNAPETPDTHHMIGAAVRRKEDRQCHEHDRANDCVAEEP